MHQRQRSLDPRRRRAHRSAGRHLGRSARRSAVQPDIDLNVALHASSVAAATKREPFLPRSVVVVPASISRRPSWRKRRAPMFGVGTSAALDDGKSGSKAGNGQLGAVEHHGRLRFRSSPRSAPSGIPRADAETDRASCSAVSRPAKRATHRGARPLSPPHGRPRQSHLRGSGLGVLRVGLRREIPRLAVLACRILPWQVRLGRYLSVGAVDELIAPVRAAQRVLGPIVTAGFSDRQCIQERGRVGFMDVSRQE